MLSSKTNKSTQLEHFTPNTSLLDLKFPLFAEIRHELDTLEILPTSPRKTPAVLLYIWGVFLTLVAISIVAQIQFPDSFKIWTNTISDQGSPTLNPQGHLFWRIGVILNGLLHIPYIHYLSQKLMVLDYRRAHQMKRIGVISAIGFCLVGVFPLDLGTIHYLMAVIAFLGYYITASISFKIIRQNKMRLIISKDPKIQKRIEFLSVFQSYFQIAGAICLFSFIFNTFVLGQEISALLEWNYLFAICFWLLVWPPILKELVVFPADKY